MGAEFERVFTIGEVAKQWKCGRETVRKLFMNEPQPYCFVIYFPASKCWIEPIGSLLEAKATRLAGTLIASTDA